MTDNINKLVIEAEEFDKKADALSYQVKDLDYEELDFGQFCQMTTALEASVITLNLCIAAIKRGMVKEKKVEIEYIKSLPDAELECKDE